jgi:hypothetical protein
VRGSGRTAALEALVAGRPATWVSTCGEIETATGLIVCDDLDQLLDRLPPVEALNFVDALRRRRLSSFGGAVLVSSTQSAPRSWGSFANVMTLRTATLDDHRATGAPPETFDPAAAPGAGTWRGNLWQGRSVHR